MKKGSRPDNNILSARLDFGNPVLDDIIITNKKSKAQNKRAERTLIGSEQPDKLTQSRESNVEKPKTLSPGTQSNTQQTSEPKLVVDIAKVDSDSLVWSQNQQKILEWALTQYPKGTTERWDKIAEHIPGKTKARNIFLHFSLYCSGKML